MMHRRIILRDNINAITKPGLLRLSRKAGVKRLSRMMYEEFRVYLFKFMKLQMKKVVAHAGRIITADDVPGNLSDEKLEFRPNAFALTIRESAQDYSDVPLQFTPSALKKFQHFCEDHLVLMMRKSYEWTVREKRVTMYHRDLTQVRHELGLELWSDDEDD